MYGKIHFETYLKKTKQQLYKIMAINTYLTQIFIWLSLSNPFPTRKTLLVIVKLVKDSSQDFNLNNLLAFLFL